jgi:hypothetical protein
MGLTMDTPINLLDEPQVPPAAFFSLIDGSMHGLVRMACIASAVETGMFEVLETPCPVSDLASRINGTEEIVSALCGVLVSLGLLEYSGGMYRNSPVSSTYLTRSSQFSQLKYIEKTWRHSLDLFAQLPVIMRSGPVSYEKEHFFRDLSLPGMAENALTGRLQKTIRPITDLPGFGSFKRMIDLGGGHGLYAIALVQQNPSLEAVVFDLPFVTASADDYIRKYGATRVKTVGGNFFTDEIGTGYDLVFSSSNPSGKSIEMLSKISAALNPGGVFVNVQSGDSEPKDVYTMLEMKLWTIENTRRGGGHHTKEQPFLTPEYLEALEKCGLTIIFSGDIPDDYHQGSVVHMIIAEKKAVPDSRSKGDNGEPL